MNVCTYKIVGVTFDGRDGNRQKVLKRLWSEAVKEELLDLDVSFEDYLFEDSPATLVFFDGLDVGNISAGESEEVRELREACSGLDADLALSGCSFSEYMELKESWSSRRQDLRDGIIDEYDIEEMKAQLADLEEEPVYSATITFYVKEPEDDLPQPEPEPKKKRLFSRFRRK